MKFEVRSLIGIFTVIEGKLNLITNNGNLLSIKCNNDINIVNKEYINNKVLNLNLEQCYTFSEKKDDKLLISVLFIDVVNINNIKMNNINFIPINELTSNKYINKAIECLKQRLVFYSSIKKLYPNSFALVELQKLYENLLDKKYDRRNFRKKLVKFNIIEDIEILSDSKFGRPAKLYRFKEIKEDRILF